MSEASGYRHEEEIDVIAQGAKDLKVRMYSTAVVAQQFFSKMCANKDQADDDPDVVRQRLDCHKQLLNLRAMNVKVERGEDDANSRRDEELQEWLDSIEARKKAHQASKKSKESKGSVKRSATVPDKLSSQRNNGSTRSRNQGVNGTSSRTKVAGSTTASRENRTTKASEKQADGTNQQRPERKTSNPKTSTATSGNSIG